jgi:ABC-type transport system involved in cytochrome c biogenesis permease subunit
MAIVNFRGRVFAAELALLTLTMAISNYATGELLDRFGMSARTVAVGIGTLFLIPGIAWFVTQKWWDQDGRHEQSLMPVNSIHATQELSK